MYPYRKVMMKILNIGGTGNISTSVTRLLAAAGHEVYLLHRNAAASEIPHVHHILCDIHDEQVCRRVLEGYRWDCVIDWIAFTAADVQRAHRLFAGRTDQYIFISSASCYQKPPVMQVITEETPLENPYWQYSRDKIAAEEFLMGCYRDQGFPVTIVRPSHTYAQIIPYALTHGRDVMLLDRLRRGLPVVVHGDGTSLWTLTHADDLALGLCGLAGNAAALGEAFHITSEERLTWDQIIEQTADALGRSASIVHVSTDLICRDHPEWTGPLYGDKHWDGIFDTSKIRRFVPSFQAGITFSEGIRAAIRWFDEHPDQQVHEQGSHALQDALIARYS